MRKVLIFSKVTAFSIIPSTKSFLIFNISPLLLSSFSIRVFDLFFILTVAGVCVWMLWGVRFLLFPADCISILLTFQSLKIIISYVSFFPFVLFLFSDIGASNALFLDIGLVTTTIPFPPQKTSRAYEDVVLETRKKDILSVTYISKSTTNWPGEPMD